MFVFYRLINSLVEKYAFMSFNLLNVLLAGNLPPLCRVSVVIENQGRYLFIEVAKNWYIFPGGYIKWKESPAQAAIRECREETGLQVEVGEIIGYISNTSRSLSEVSSLTLVYRGKIIGGELRGSSEGRPSWQSAPEFLDDISSAVLNRYFSSGASSDLEKV